MPYIKDASMNSKQNRALKRVQDRNTNSNHHAARVARTCAALGVCKGVSCATCPRKFNTQVATQTSVASTKPSTEDRIITAFWWGLLVYSIVCGVGVAGYIYQVVVQS